MMAQNWEEPIKIESKVESKSAFNAHFGYFMNNLLDGLILSQAQKCSIELFGCQLETLDILGEEWPVLQQLIAIKRGLA